MSAEKRDPITIAALEARNFRRLTFAQVEHVPGRGLVRVQGKNGSGKTSLLRAIMGVLGGKGEVDEASLRDGEETGEIRVRLSNGFHVERRFTEAAPKGYLVVTSEDGGQYGQGKLTEWLGATAFDPQAFFALSPDRQRDLLFTLGTDPDLPEKLDEVRKEYAETYEKRTPVISEKRHLAKVAKPEGEKPEPVDTSAELAKLRELQAAERERQDKIRSAQETKRQADQYPGAIADQESVIAELKRRLADAEEELSRLQGLAEKAEAQADKEMAEAEELPDPSEEIEAVQTRLEEADATNTALEPWKRWEEAEARMEELKQAEENLTAQLGALKNREASLLEKAGIPVEGLSFSDEGEPLLDGRPLAVASGAERVRMAVQVAMAANPDLRVVLLDEEANSLDEDALSELHELATEHGFQVWAARVVDDPASEVVVEDGVARDRETEAAGA